MNPDPAPIHPPQLSTPHCSRRSALRGLSGAALGLLGAGTADRVLAASTANHMNIITGDLKSWRTLKGIKGLEAGLEFLEKTDLKSLPMGKLVIDGDNLYATVAKSPSRAPESGQFEAHRKYIDIQYLVAGEELIGVAPTGSLKVTTPYSEANDVALYALPKEYQNIEMQPGRFVVFFPEDAHLPLCHCNGAQELYKVVVKVKVDYWKAGQTA